MKRFFLAAWLLLLGFAGLQAQTVLEDFEGGTSDLPWVGINGTYNGVVDNPDPSGINTSAYVGSYTNADSFDFNFAIANLAQPVDLSEFNQIRVKIWSPVGAPAKALFKFEGGGKAVEKIVNLTAANEWVEYSFDLSAGATYTTLTSALISFNSFVLGDHNTYYFDDIRLVKNEKVYEDFETPSGITWTSLNGTYTGAVPNPAPNQVNGSATVGCFSNNPAADYNFAFGTFAAPLDLTVYNQFYFDLYAPQPTQVLFKLEGAGIAKEFTLNVAVTNAWQTYHLDMSALKDETTITKILIVFSPGVLGSSDAYYIDNIRAEPNQCADVEPDPTIIDDFECNRNATYWIGWDSLSVVKNPYPDGDNSSAKVGKFVDPAGNGTEYAALVIDYENPIDLSVRNQFQLQVYAPKAGTLLLKIEGGTSPLETPFQITAADVNKWKTFTFDVRNEVAEGHKRFVIFFNAGVNGAPGDVYYIDNIKLIAPALEDFQGIIPSLGWVPLDLNTVLNGNFTGPTPNPNPNNVNSSSQVGCYSKGSSPTSTLAALAGVAFDLSEYSQFNLDVLSPASVAVDTKVRMILSSATQGNKEVDAKVKTPGQWETLSFDFSSFVDITDFFELRLIFNPGTASPGESWCIDNLNLGEVTTDACADVVPNPYIIDDYECQRNFTSIFYGGADISVVNNPHLTSDNGSTKVGAYADPAGAFAGIGYEFATPPDLTTYNHLQLQVWSPTANVPFLFKLQGGTTGAVEIYDTLTEANKWYKFDIDFSAAAGTDNKQLVIFVNVLNDLGGGTYFIDNVKWGRAAYNGCFVDFETPATTITAFNYFDQGSYNTGFEVVNNPDPDAVNSSQHVGKFVKPSDGGNFTGFYTDLDAPVDFAGLKQMKAKIYMDHLGVFILKLEQDKSGNNLGATEIPYNNTKVNEWEETFHDFSTAPDNARYQRFTIFFDWQMPGNGTSNVISYFDDIVIGAGECGVSGTWQPIPVEPMKVSPNPVSDLLRVDNFKNIGHMEVINAFGQRVITQTVDGDLRTDIDVSRLPNGVYGLAGYSPQGLLIGNAKFVVQR